MGEPPFSMTYLQNSNVRCLWAFLAALYVEFYRLTFGQSFKT